MKEQDKQKACEAIQEIEADLTYKMVEAYQENRMEEFAEALEALRVFLQVRKDTCP